MEPHYHIDKQITIFLSLAALVPFKTFTESEVNILLHRALTKNNDPRYDYSHIRVGLKELGLLTSNKDSSEYKVNLEKTVEIGLKLKILTEKHQSFDITGLEKVLVKKALKKEIIKL